MNQEEFMKQRLNEMSMAELLEIIKDNIKKSKQKENIFEGDKIPKSWIEHLMDERVSQVWVLSQHVKDAVLKTFYDNCYDSQFNKKTLQIFLNKIKIVPHGVKVNLEVFYPEK